FFSSRRRHTRFSRDWSSDVCSSDLHEEKLAMLNQAKAQLSHEFKALATQILDENSRKMAEQNRDTLDNVLQPLRLQLSDFRQKRSEERRVGKSVDVGERRRARNRTR